MTEGQTPTPMTTPMTLDTITLARGGHASPADGLCVMEAVAYIAREPHSDHPQCVSPVIAAFLRSWNDGLDDADRNRLLKPVLLATIGTRTTDADEETRAWLATDWLCRVQTPAWLRLAGLTSHAEALEATARIVDAVTARSAQPTLDAARDAAWAAARDAARDAAWAAARDAAWDAARDAARAAARDAAWDAARDAARAAAGAAAGAAARDAAGAAANISLRPTVEQLQASACELVLAMCNVGRVEAIR